MIGNTSLGVMFTGDISGLLQALGQAGGGIDRFGNRAEGNLRGVRREADNATTGIARLASGLKAAFVGSSVAVALIGLKNSLVAMTGAIVQAQVEVDRLRNGFKFGAGGTAGGAAELGFVREQAQRLGVELGGTAGQYMKMVAASRGNKMAGDQTRELFLAIAEASVVMGMGVDQSQRSFTAVTQMMSKGKIMAEELRGQLGEHLPGAFSIAARAMGKTEVELNKMLETGQVFSDDFLPKFSRQLRKELVDSVKESSQSMQSNLNRMSTAWQVFKQEVAQSGLGDFISKQIQGIATELTLVSEQLERSRLAGDGFWATLGKSAGIPTARAAFGLLELSVFSFNSVLNAVMPGMYKFNTEVDLTPDLLKPVSVQLEIMRAELVEAEKAQVTLAARLEAQPDSIWTKSSIHQTNLLVLKLREAIAAKDLLSAGVGDPTNYGNEAGREASRVGDLKAIKERQAALDALQARFASAETKGLAEVAKQRALIGALFTPALEKQIMDSFVKPVQGGARAVREVRDEFAELMSRLGAKDAGLDPSFTKDLQTLYAGFEKGRVGVDDYRSAVEKLIMAQQFAKDGVRDQLQAEKDLASAYEKRLGSMEKDAATAQEALARQLEENRAIGLTAEQLAAVEAARLRSTAASKLWQATQAENIYLSDEMSVALRAEAQALYDRVDAVQAGAGKRAAGEMFDKAAAESLEFWESVDETARSTFVDVANNGMDAFKRIGQTLKAAVLDMLYQMTLKKWIFQIAGVGGGAGGLSGAANAAGQGGAGRCKQTRRRRNVRQSRGRVAGVLGVGRRNRPQHLR